MQETGQPWKLYGVSGDCMRDYAEFINRKMQLGSFDGFEPNFMPDFLFDFQRSIVEWGVRKGKAAFYEDCGLGKTPQQLVWAQNVVMHTNKPVLILTPLAVCFQTVAEAGKFGIECYLMRDKPSVKYKAAIYVTNYERLHYFNADDFAGVVCDESSILKSFDGAYRGEITEFMRKTKYRLLCTATAAPNDYIELGTSSEALGELGYTDMLTRFFKNDQNTVKPMRYTGYGAPRGAEPMGGHTDKWRFKGHAEQEFWRWVCSWARAVRKPSDLGFDDAQFTLPALIENERMVGVNTAAPGMLFALPAVGLKEQREERRRTITERCEAAATLVADTGEPALMWCHMNDEGDMLEKLVPGAVQVSGKDTDESKEEKFIAFTTGQARVLVTKPKIGAWGLNFQHCNHVTTFPSHSFEQYYQGVRRCWRFGQKRQVTVDMVTTEGEAGVIKNLQRKAAQADRMFADLISHMNDALKIDRSIQFTKKQELPAWL